MISHTLDLLFSLTLVLHTLPCKGGYNRRLRRCVRGSWFCV